jgi:hypothetical protein
MKNPTPTKYNVWLHIEGVDQDDDVLEGDEHNEPHKIGTFGTAHEAQERVWLVEQLLRENEKNHLNHSIP